MATKQEKQKTNK